MRHFVVFFCLIAATVFLWETAAAQTPNTLSYQGLLTTTAGTPVPDGTYKLQFDLFTDSASGLSFWTETDSGIAVRRGAFSVILGVDSALPDSFHRPLYLQATGISGPGIGSPVTFLPRSPLTSAPYAMGLKVPITAGSNFPIIQGDNTGIGSGVRGHTNSGSANLGGVTGQTFGVNGNGMFGMAFNGNQAWGVGGWSDTGVGTAGYVGVRNGIGVGGYNINPNGLGLYSYGRLRVDALGGDSAVILPPNSVSSYEMLDVPGLSQGINNSGVTLTGQTTMTVDSTTITIPAAGYIVVEAFSEAGFFNTTGANQLCYGIDSLPPPAFDYGHYACVGLLGYPNTNFGNYFPVAASRTFYCGPGTHTFWFKAFDDSSPSGDKYLWEPVITAIYFPRAYGAVNAVVAPEENPGFSTAAQAASNFQQAGSLTKPVGSVVDLRELELKVTKLREEAERAENELLRAKMEKLKTLDHSGGPSQ